MQRRLSLKPEGREGVQHTTSQNKVLVSEDVAGFKSFYWVAQAECMTVHGFNSHNVLYWYCLDLVGIVLKFDWNESYVSAPYYRHTHCYCNHTLGWG
jgi:hypothetical protein